MGLTPVYGFPYPGVNDSPNGPSQIQSLAEAVEADLATTDAAAAALAGAVALLPKGRIASASSAATALNTVEAVVDLFTVALTVGRRYRTIANYCYGTDATNYFFRMRYQAGTTAGLGGTIFRRLAPNGALTLNTPITLVGDFVAPSSGTYTISVTCFMGVGAGSIPNDGANHDKFAMVEDIGV